MGGDGASCSHALRVVFVGLAGKNAEGAMYIEMYRVTPGDDGIVFRLYIHICCMFDTKECCGLAQWTSWPQCIWSDGEVRRVMLRLQRCGLAAWSSLRLIGFFRHGRRTIERVVCVIRKGMAGVGDANGGLCGKSLYRQFGVGFSARVVFIVLCT